MKMHYPHYDQLRRLIAESLADRNLSIQAVETDYKKHGLSERRMAFDLLWSIPQQQRQSWFDSNAIYDYLNDDHIHTALKQSIKDIKQGKSFLAALTD